MPEPSPPGFGLRPIYLHAKLFWLEWARRDMTALHHPDIHRVLTQIADIERELAGR